MYVVTGASGNTGSAVAKNLLAKGQKVRVIGRNLHRLDPLVTQGAEPFVIDLADAAALSRAFTGAQGVYAMIPPDVASPDFRAYQERISNAIVDALKQAD